MDVAFQVDRQNYVNLAFFTHIFPVKLVGSLAKYLEFQQMISGQCFCTLLALKLSQGQVIDLVDIVIII
jgi:hypothetical protein